ncbi:hypothetical protein ABEB36_010443 [Hypothenemus hampei]|uniref:Uncharacterized protein n=1 Tax=Hypothenemus hampei TaxID=57062 RepID=A0ABD1ENV6_HYPHA
MDTVLEVSECDEKIAETVGKIAVLKRDKRRLTEEIKKLANSRKALENQKQRSQHEANCAGPIWQENRLS